MGGAHDMFLSGPEQKVLVSMQLVRLDGHRTACCRESGEGLNGGHGLCTVMAV